MKVLKEKDKQGLSLQKKQGTKTNLSQDSSAASCKQLHGNTSFWRQIIYLGFQALEIDTVWYV